MFSVKTGQLFKDHSGSPHGGSRGTRFCVLHVGGFGTRPYGRFRAFRDFRGPDFVRLRGKSSSRRDTENAETQRMLRVFSASLFYSAAPRDGFSAHQPVTKIN